MIRQYIRDLKDHGRKVAWYNAKFQMAYKALHAKRMRVTARQEGDITIPTIVVIVIVIIILFWIF